MLIGRTRDRERMGFPFSTQIIIIVAFIVLAETTEKTFFVIGKSLAIKSANATGRTDSFGVFALLQVFYLGSVRSWSGFGHLIKRI